MSRADLERYVLSWNSFHPSIRFTYTISDVQAVFLDIHIFFLPKRAYAHRYTIKKRIATTTFFIARPPLSDDRDSIPYSQLLRLRRLCTDDSDFEARSDEMLDFFRVRGYPERVLALAKHKLGSVSRVHAMTPPAVGNGRRQTDLF